jgi:hypothetical protein
MADMQNNPYFQEYLLPKPRLARSEVMEGQMSQTEVYSQICRNAGVEPDNNVIQRIYESEYGVLPKVQKPPAEEAREQKRFEPIVHRRVRVRLDNKPTKKCMFCKSKEHCVRESSKEDAEVTCPVLRETECTYCHRKGHTKKMCSMLHRTSSVKA